MSPRSDISTSLARTVAVLAAAAGVAILALFTPASAGVVSIFPSTLEATVNPGDDVTTVVRIHYGKDGPDDTQPVRILVATEDWDMDEAGQLSFDDGEPAAAPDWSARDWIVFSPGEAEIVPGQTLTLRVSILVPADTPRGEYRAALIAQPRAPFRPQAPGTRRLELLCRLASIVYVTVPPVADAVELENVRLVAHEEGWRVVPRFLNTGEATIRVFDSFEILPLDVAGFGFECRRDEQEAGVVLPGRSRELAANLPCELPAGTYSLLYRADVGEDLPVLEGERTFTVPSAQAPVAAVAD